MTILELRRRATGNLWQDQATSFTVSTSMPRDFAQPEVRQEWLHCLRSPLSESRWDELTSELFTWHYQRVLPYRRLAQAHGLSPATYQSWKEIPAMPQQVFKLERLYAHGKKQPEAVYETSGTTTGQPGRQFLWRTDLYQGVSLSGAEHLLQNKPLLHFLTPSPLEAPLSSLSAMFGFWQEASARATSAFWIRGGVLDSTGLREALVDAILSGQPVGLCGTAFSYVHLLDAWDELPPLNLAPGSWLLETGGFKGRSREVAKPTLYAQLARCFTLPESSLWNEYGMSELSSQAYAYGLHGLHHTPPWARVLVINPSTGREVGLGQRGLIRWIDLANVDSVLALQTLDLAEKTREGFRLIGRLPRTEPRGCSLGLEDLLQQEATS